jgi:hypothetical protein
MPGVSSSPWIRGAPERILSVQPSDQLAHVLRNRWTAGPLATTLPRPKQPKPWRCHAMTVSGVTMMSADRQSGPETTEPHPEEPINGGQLGSLYRTLKDTELMTKHEDLELKGRAAAE